MLSQPNVLFESFCGGAGWPAAISINLKAGSVLRLGCWKKNACWQALKDVLVSAAMRDSDWQSWTCDDKNLRKQHTF